MAIELDSNGESFYFLEVTRTFVGAWEKQSRKSKSEVFVRENVMKNSSS